LIIIKQIIEIQNEFFNKDILKNYNMAFTNIEHWAVYYKEILSTKYYEFRELFPKGEAPTYKDFVNFVWINTTKAKNFNNGKVESKLN